VAVYAIGDIQGCLEPLERLLEMVGFDPAADRVWFTGDLVNRGPASLKVLRLVRDLGERAVTVLGNHDLHLLAVWSGEARLKRNDSLQQILDAPDCDELMDWLRGQPLLHHDAELNALMVHAGVLPGWSLQQARDHAAQAEAVLRGEEFRPFMASLYGDEPSRWDPQLQGWDRLRFIVNVFTRMRFLANGGQLMMDFKGAPADSPPGYEPWFRQALAWPAGRPRVIFGHWSTLGFVNESGVIALDTGCLWGGQLTAVRLDGPLERHSLDCPVSMPVGADSFHY
jgi:bis(5'-nucleosyl)-tetraphosphatase (symmetrical)